MSFSAGLKMSPVVFAMALAAGAARADVLDLTLGGASAYAIGDFSAWNSATQGAIVAGGNVTLSSYAVNQNNLDAYGSYALVAGGNLNVSNGKINNGSYYAGGRTSIASNVGLGTASVATAAPLSFAATSAYVKSASLALSTVASTGTASLNYGGLYLSGSNSAVEVFNISADDMAKSGWLSLSALSTGSTLILNIAGTSASASILNGFSGYNVVYNFYEATSVNVSGVGLYGTLLAPLATVTGGNAQINGSVIAGAWDASVAINAKAFAATNVAGYALASAVPEAQTWTMLLAGLAVIFLGVRRRKPQARPFSQSGVA